MAEQSSANDPRDTNDTDQAMTGRALLVLKGEVGSLHEMAQRVKIQVDALSKRYGIKDL